MLIKKLRVVFIEKLKKNYTFNNGTRKMFNMKRN